MKNEQLVWQIRKKIERLTQRSVDLVIDESESANFRVDLAGEIPQVILGSDIFEYAGFARMCVEYVVESIRQQRLIAELEFHVLLARN
ncbi:MAG: hypothetical protein O2909_04815 [Chloroflexi bacterium]|nr:hypothetical protein [Chloroflexota bacterium]MDA1218745.1 hypothetical protein [Chloroflexota bacterium]PKB58043.1 MAG: hypothetical protein BZY73_00145 [SAR202 cluster bacterium Casp-Chloro-G3]